MPRYIVLGFSTVKIPFFFQTDAEDAEEAAVIVKASVKDRSGNTDEEITLVKIIDVGEEETPSLIEKTGD